MVDLLKMLYVLVGLNLALLTAWPVFASIEGFNKVTTFDVVTLIPIPTLSVITFIIAVALN